MSSGSTGGRGRGDTTIISPNFDDIIDIININNSEAVVY